MTPQPPVITFADELLADTSVRRAYSDGRYEWRRRLPDGRVEWQDNVNQSGVDELLGDGIIKRSYADGRVVYARDQGYGRTLWGGAQPVLTLNFTSLGGRAGRILAGLGAGAMLGALVFPPDSLTAAEEEALREQARQAAASGGDTGSSAGFDDGGSDGGFDGDGGDGGGDGGFG